MEYKAQNKVIDLTQITRLYPAARVNVNGEYAQVSLEWADIRGGDVNIDAYLLVFDIDPLGEIPNNRIELIYETKDELIDVMKDVATYFEK